jgi:hypothetical protein
MGRGEARAQENRGDLRAGGRVRKVSISFKSVRKLVIREETLVAVREARAGKARGGEAAARDSGIREAGVRGTGAREGTGIREGTCIRGGTRVRGALIERRALNDSERARKRHTQIDMESLVPSAIRNQPGLFIMGQAQERQQAQIDDYDTD